MADVGSESKTKNSGDASKEKKAATESDAGQKSQKKSADGAARGKNRKKETSGGSVTIAAAGETKVSPSKEPRLHKMYREKVVPEMMKQFQFGNIMEVPRIEKISINCALKDAVGNPKILDSVVDEIMAITGQKPVLTKAKKAIAAFKLRKGNTIGVMVTLRRARMYEFLDRLMNVALARVRDFKGVSPKAFDGRGNYSFGIKEQIIFPEINYDAVEKIHGLTVTITTSAKNNEHARAVLAELGMPFRK